MDADRFLSEIEVHVKAAPEPWTVNLDPSGFWISVRPEGVRTPAQGWKLHVSAGLSSAQAVLHKVLQILLADPTPFKVTRSVGQLDLLNTGMAGMSQVGKFVTVYPTDDAQAVRLAAALHVATAGLRGPVFRPISRSTRAAWCTTAMAVSPVGGRASSPGPWRR